MNFLYRLFFYVVLPIVLTIAAVVGSAYYWAHAAVKLPAPYVDVLVPPGATAATISRTLAQSGVQINPRFFSWLARFGGFDTKLKAGGYQVVQGDTPWTVLRRMAQGDMTQRQLTLVEGWNLRQIRAALAQHPDLRHTLDQSTDAQLVELLGANATFAEGLLFPDTYIFPIGTTDLDVLQRAYRAQQQVLQKAWEQRAADLPIASPYEALILASLIEKETGSASDRARIAGVFINRLRAGMPLQTDPSVIYGMGEAYEGKIRKRDLQTDTPWNTYTRTGLPPSPIAIVGRASLAAALQPEKHGYYYFVSRGDGSSAFASTLAEHNKNVSTYILGRKP